MSDEDAFLVKGDENTAEGLPLDETEEKYEIKNKQIRKIAKVSKKNIYILIIIVLSMLIVIISLKKK